jgi:hypothetical protein
MFRIGGIWTGPVTLGHCPFERRYMTLKGQNVNIFLHKREKICY